MGKLSVVIPVARTIREIVARVRAVPLDMESISGTIPSPLGRR